MLLTCFFLRMSSFNVTSSKEVQAGKFLFFLPGGRATDRWRGMGRVGDPST